MNELKDMDSSFSSITYRIRMKNPVSMKFLKKFPINYYKIAKNLIANKFLGPQL